MIKSSKYKDRIKLNKFKISNDDLIISVCNNYNIDHHLKKEFCFILEYKKEVRCYYYQPIKLEIENSFYYVPDFYIESWDENKQFVDFNLKKDISISIVDFMRENNIQHHFIRPQYFQTSILSNSKFLLLYKIPKLGFKVSDIMIITNLLQLNKELSIQSLIDKAVLDKSKKAEILYVVWYMIANYHLITDIEKPLSMNSIVRLN